MEFVSKEARSTNSMFTYDKLFSAISKDMFGIRYTNDK